MVEKDIRSYNEESDKGYFLEVDVQNLCNLHNDLPFLRQRMKIEKAEKLLANLHNKSEYFKHAKNLKQASNHKLVL